MSARQKQVLIGLVVAVVALVAFVIGVTVGDDDDDSAVDAADTTSTSVESTSSSVEATSSTVESTTSTPPADLPRPVVVADGYVLGWFEDGQWMSAVAEFDEPLPPAPLDDGAEYRFVGLGRPGEGGPLRPTTASVGRVDFGCYLENNHGVQARAAAGTIGLPAGYDLLPREPEVIAASPAHERSVTEWLRDRGVSDPEVSIDRVTRVDIEGDGRDEVFIEASRLANPGLLDEEEGDYSVVLLRSVDENDDVSTLEIAGDVVDAERANSEDFGGYISTVEALAFADVDQDGDLEFAIRTAAYESGGVELYDIEQGNMQWIGGTGCGA